jgi:hypothetical protein
LSKYIENNIRKYKIVCPHEKYKTVFEENKGLSILNSTNSKWKKIRTDILNNYEMVKNPFYFSCAHGCGAAYILPGYMVKVVCNKCGKNTCFRHKVQWHYSMTCEQFEMIREKDTDKYIDSHVKTCPFCKEGVEKRREQDCDKMTCICGYTYCYLCGADYETILREGNHYHKRDCRHYFPIES